MLSRLFFCACMLLTGLAMAEPVTLKSADDVKIYGEYYKAEHPKALILLFHQAGSNRAEYATIAPRLVKEGYSALAIDQRSGGKLFGHPNETVTHLGHSAEYLAAEKDLEAALAWAGAQQLPVAIWGSSYSSSLVFLVAGKHPSEVKAVLSFSPGEYLGTPNMVQTAAAKVSAPLYVTSAKDDDEIAAAKAIVGATASKSKTQFIPKIGGVHGSSTLRDDRNAKGSAENWTAVLGFLKTVF